MASWKGDRKYCTDTVPSEQHLFDKSSVFKTLDPANQQRYNDARTVINGKGFISSTDLNATLRKNLNLFKIQQSNHSWCQNCYDKSIHDCESVSDQFHIPKDENRHWNVKDLHQSVTDIQNEPHDLINLQDIVNKMNALKVCVESRYKHNYNCYRSSSGYNNKVRHELKLVVEPGHNRMITQICSEMDRLKNILQSDLEEKGNNAPWSDVCDIHLNDNIVLESHNKVTGDAYKSRISRPRTIKRKTTSRSKRKAKDAKERYGKSSSRYKKAMDEHKKYRRNPNLRVGIRRSGMTVPKTTLVRTSGTPNWNRLKQLKLKRKI